MIRYLRVAGVTAVMMGAGLVPPVLFDSLEQEHISDMGVGVLSLAAILILSGVVAMILRRPSSGNLSTPPAPVRAVILANLCFLAFCMLEVSDGLVRQGGRIFYWTTVLFAPAIVVHCGVIFTQRWAWWTARCSALIFVVWFGVFVLLIPFADLRGSSGPIPWYGRAYMIVVSTIFASIAAYVYRSLGQAETRSYFGISRRASVTPLT